MRKEVFLTAVLGIFFGSDAAVFEKDGPTSTQIRTKRNDFTNNYGYGPFGVGPSNGGFDSNGFYRDKFYNSGLPPLYTFAAYRNYYHEISFHKNKYGKPAPTDFEVLQQERFGPYYDGVWGYSDHSNNWFGKRK